MRVFKTRWSTKAARKARISDAELRRAIAEVALGQADDLGGGVFKKRLSENRLRSIILARVGRFWVYAFLFAKQDRSNIRSDELEAFRSLVDAYAGLTDEQIEALIVEKDFVEVSGG